MQRVLIWAMVWGFFHCSVEKRELPTLQTADSTVYQEIYSSSLFYLNGPLKVWELHADYMRKQISGTGEVLTVPVRLTFYDSTGVTRTVVLSDSGTTNAARDSFVVWGDVYVRNRDSMEVRAERLVWSRDARTVSSDKFVKITTPKGDVLQGVGLRADENFRKWSILENVRGETKNFKRRADDEELFGTGAE